MTLEQKIHQRCATVDAENMARVYFERARSKPDISLLGTPVQRLPYDDDKNVEGVILEADTPRKPSSPPEPGQVVS